MGTWGRRLKESCARNRPLWRRGDRARGYPPADELPLINEVQHPVALRELRREGVEGAGEPEDGECRLIERRVAAGAADGRLIEAPIRVDGDRDHGIGVRAGLPGGRGV